MNSTECFFEVNSRVIGCGYPTYFIADIAANHDGDLQRAKDLIYLAAESGADVAKFQHFQADSIVSDYGFSALKNKSSHHANWKKSVYQVYEDASTDKLWTEELKTTCEKANITFFSSPYSFDLVDFIDPYVPAYKIGSGDITWIDLITHIAKKQKPCFIASGASTEEDVKRAMNALLAFNKKICLMQCNTNYTGNLENFRYIQLNVLKRFKQLFPDIVLGLSDHTPGHSSVLGAVALGARVIEKHFTDDINREGPDHNFAMDAKAWRSMVDATRELELSLGDQVKKIEDNELDTVILQRRSIRLKAAVKKGTIITKDLIEFLRPCPADAIEPYMVEEVLGREITRDLPGGDCLKWADIK